jgi:RNA polymerase sigma-70 factor (ECF subfamily)
MFGDRFGAPPEVAHPILEKPPMHLTAESLRPHLPALRAAAARASRDPDDAEDLLQDALLEAVRAARTDLSQSVNVRWLFGTLAHMGAMRARSAGRRRVRETAWVQEREVLADASPSLGWWGNDRALREWLAGLPPSLRPVAELALSGHNRREIAWLLRLTDGTLRQRIAALRRRIPAASAVRPSEEDAALILPLGLIRRALLPVVVAQKGTGAYDPDGHLLVLAGRGGTPLR